jgi:predicted dehydrogenase/acetyltransferase-like isoleucine patch superfamily enzyme
MIKRSPVRLAVWGIGYHAQKNVLPAIDACDAVVLAGVCSRNQKTAQAAAKRWGGSVWLEADAMLASMDVDAVYLCTPIGLHYEQGLAVVEAHKHLLCEKALTDKAERSLDLISSARRQDVALCEAFMYQFHPQFRSLLELTRGSDFGGVEALSCWFGMPVLENPGFRNSAVLGGGGFLDVACYPISLAAQLIDGLPQIVSLRLNTSSGDEVDTTGHATLQFPGGEVAHLDWGFGRSYRNEVSVWGKKKSVFADRIFSKAPDYESSIVLRGQSGLEEQIRISPANAFCEMLKDFGSATTDKSMREKLWDLASHQAKLVARAEQRMLAQRGRVTNMPGSLDHVDIRGKLTVGENVTIDTNVIVKGEVTLADRVSIEPNCVLENSSIGAGTSVRANSIVESAQIGKDCIIGPYARVRAKTEIGDGAQIGNFVEVKESLIGPGSKINHHAFIGNATLGRGVIIGAGTVTCNFDGRKTQPTRIDDDAFIGSGCQLIAPISIGARAVIGAGSTVTQDAPSDKLTVARARQVTVAGWSRGDWPDKTEND